MGDEGEKACPLCAEDMDLTDQQLKPCKCGYEICVWCWHHIMDMAEKDATEGRCPACRAPYDKEKIVGTAAKCERFVAEINMDKKMKLQKAKAKTSEGRKQLSGARVIQRNLVYIVGLPLNLADEDLLQRREYFGQYGKVLKVSMSRTAAGVVQQFPNNTCSVYITYSKEEEAIRCIQNVHQFVLEGKPLRACFGTTKYCHAWLRNVPCSNPDCLYLHEIGSQEDSFTKDEIISAYTRSRVQQVTGAANNMQRRSGDVLPPPLDDYCNNNYASAGKPTVKNASNNIGSVVRGSPPNGNSGSSVALPAAASWGTHPNGQLYAVSLACSNGPSKQKQDTVSNSTLTFSSAVASTTQACTRNGNLRNGPSLNEESRPTSAKGQPEPVRSLSSQLSSPSEREGNCMTSTEHTRQSCFYQEIDGPDAAVGPVENLCANMSSMSMDRNFTDEHSSPMIQDSSFSNNGLTKPSGNQDMEEHYLEHCRDPVTLTTAERGPPLNEGGSILNEGCDWRSEFHDVAPNTCEVEDVLSFDLQRLKDPLVASHSTCLPNFASPLLGFDHSGSHSLQHVEDYAAAGVNAYSPSIDEKTLLHESGMTTISNIYPQSLASSCDASGWRQRGRLSGDAENVDQNVLVDKGESSIISNILSLDSDMWDDSFSSPQNLAKLLGESEKQSGSLKMSGSWKVQNNSQSRFSFARQEESKNQAFEIQSSLDVIGKMPKNYSSSSNFSENDDVYLDKLRMGSSMYSTKYYASENQSGGRSVTFSNNLSVSRAQNSAPPGFSLPSRSPPPGFSSHDRAFDFLSGNHLFDTSSLLRSSYQAPQQTGNTGNACDIEFMDPAILAVGEGRFQNGHNNRGLEMRLNYPPQLGALDNEARHLLIQRSLSSQQNPRVSDVRDSFSHLSDSYGVSSMFADQSHVNNLSPFAQLSLQHSRNGPMSNSHWDGWSEVGGNTLGIADILRNDRLGYKLYSGFEESKFRIPRKDDMYNRTFGM